MTFCSKVQWNWIPRAQVQCRNSWFDDRFWDFRGSKFKSLNFETPELIPDESACFKPAISLILETWSWIDFSVYALGFKSKVIDFCSRLDNKSASIVSFGKILPSNNKLKLVKYEYSVENNELETV
ncbi:hypothetical protein WICMUC_001155 [Wickerhamomyces mucosus]|uniref:Uncharacterized protein n=1 Tax=Wickerhamomyces mucosus TaxID=1378264 RepID=A0A9P8THM6_9ASCO|nr:hypothetical protein WICMUC_001155 [Wickerhamomyces mucosus]